MRFNARFGSATVGSALNAAHEKSCALTILFLSPVAAAIQSATCNCFVNAATSQRAIAFDVVLNKPLQPTAIPLRGLSTAELGRQPLSLEAMVKKRNLKGYKREGKRFIPPMKQLPMVREQSYVNDMLPELIWLGLIHDRRGYRFGAKVLETIIEVTKAWPKNDKPRNYAVQAAYEVLTPEQKTELLEALTTASVLEDIRYAVAPLVLLYDGFALSFVGPPPTVIPREVLVQRITDCVRKHLDKYETPGIVLNGAMLLTRLVAGTIKIAAHIEIPDLNAVVERPDSDEARKAASFMRANAIGEFGMLELPPTWAKHFWNRGADLAPCQLPEYARDE